MELLQVDVSNPDKLSEALSTRNSLTGIIHAAGIVRDCRLEHLDWKRFLEVLKPKVHGAYFLHQLLKERKLSVFCMFSSWSASFGVEGQCNYMSANSFLDALAHYRQEDGLCGQSLAWSAWGEVGMARGLRLPKGMVAMLVSLALKAFFDVLTMPDPHIVLVHDDGTLRNGSPTFHDGQRRTRKGQSDLDFLPVILKAISDLESWQTDKEVGCEGGFTDLGLDSLDISILSNLISEETGINVSWHDIFSHPSCKELANFLAQQARLQLPESHECGVVEGGAGSAGEDDAIPAERDGMDAKIPSNTEVDNSQLQANGDTFESESGNHGANGEGVQAEIEPNSYPQLEAASLSRKFSIVGVACRYPGQVNMFEDLWQVLSEGRNCVSEIPRDRWERWEACEEIYTGHIAHIDGLDLFDASFFHVPPSAAKYMDPQVRMSLETVLHVLEDAGISMADPSSRKTAVFTGYMTSDYLQHIGHVQDKSVPTGTMHGIFPGVISHFFNFHGSSQSTLSACSSSLAAVDRAKMELNIEPERSNTALALGANAIFCRDLIIQACLMKMLSKLGQCRSFDETADGYVRGEGCGAVLLEKHSQRNAHGYVLGSAVLHDGRSAALVVPNPSGQQDVIKSALKDCQTLPSHEFVTYLEAHGTGTPKGDPLEIKALRSVFEKRVSPLLVSTAKSTFGHLEAASGMIGLHKVLCSMKHQSISRHISLRKVSDEVMKAAGESKWCDIVGESVNWSGSSAGVSSFGLSGTNAHAVIQSPASQDMPYRAQRGLQLLRRLDQSLDPPDIGILLLSAASLRSLELLKQAYLVRLQKEQQSSLWSFCMSAAVGRSHMRYRFAAVGSRCELIRLLGAGQGWKPLQVAQANVSKASQEIVRLELGSLKNLKPRKEDMEDLRIQNPTFRGLLEEGVPKAVALYALLQRWGFQVEVAGPSGVIDFKDVACGSDLHVSRLKFAGDTFSLSEAGWIPTLLKLLSTVYLSGDVLDWSRCFESFGYKPASFSSLPLYPFDRKQHWYSQTSLCAEFIMKDPQCGTFWYSSHLLANGVCCILLDHRISDGALLPAAAHIEILSDVAGQVFSIQRKLGDTIVVLENIRFQNPLYLQPGTRYTLQISAALENEHISLEVFDQTSSLRLCTATASASAEASVDAQTLEELPQKGVELDSSQIYSWLAARGLQYQGHFQILEHARMSDLGVSAKLCLERIPVCIIDGAMQALALASNLSPSTGSKVPTKIRRIEFRSSVANVTQVYAQWKGTPVVFLLDADRRLIAKLEGIEVMEKGHEMMFFREKWLPGNSGILGLTQSEYLQQESLSHPDHCEASEVYDSELLKQEEKRNSDLNELARAIAVEGLHKNVFKDLLKARLREHGDPVIDGFRLARAIEERKRCIEKIEPCPEKDLLLKCGEAVLSQSPIHLSLMFPEANKVYADGISSKAANQIVGQQVAKLLSVTPHRCKVLEIGAGTGATSQSILDVAPDEFPRSNYVFTDVYKPFMDEAEKKLGVTVKSLNIEQDPQRQGFIPYTFNAIVCANVLHATKNIPETLKHVRRLCAPNSWLILSETVVQDDWLDLTFGLLDGWWRFEDDRVHHRSPLLSCEQWEEKLKQAGFYPFMSIGRRQVVLLARALPQNDPAKSLLDPSPWLLIGARSQFSLQLLEFLKQAGHAVLHFQAQGFVAAKLFINVYQLIIDHHRSCFRGSRLN